MTKVTISAEYTSNIADDYGDRIICRFAQSASIQVTVTTNGKKQFGRTYHYGVTLPDDNPVHLFEQVANKRFGIDRQIWFDGSNEKFPDADTPVDVVIIPSPFLDALFEYLKMLNKPALEYFN